MPRKEGAVRGNMTTIPSRSYSAAFLLEMQEEGVEVTSVNHTLPSSETCMHRATTYMERFCNPAAFSRVKKTTSTYLRTNVASESLKVSKTYSCVERFLAFTSRDSLMLFGLRFA